MFPYTRRMKTRVTRDTRRGDVRRRCIKHEPETDNNYLLQWKQELKRDRRTVLPIYNIRLYIHIAKLYISIFTYNNKGTFIFSHFPSSWAHMRVSTRAFRPDQPCGYTAFLNCLKTIFFFIFFFQELLEESNNVCVCS